MIKLVELGVCAGLNVFLTPRLGYLGSMWAIVVSSGLTAFCGYFYFQDFLRKESLASLLVVMLTGFAVLAILHVSPSLPPFIAFSAGVISFAVLMILFKIVAWRDVSFVFTNIVRKKRAPF